MLRYLKNDPILYAALGSLGKTLHHNVRTNSLENLPWKPDKHSVYGYGDYFTFINIKLIAGRVSLFPGNDTQLFYEVNLVWACHPIENHYSAAIKFIKMFKQQPERWTCWYTLDECSDLIGFTN